ncbi:hypothetical protein PR202_ga16858 [Eleusine coracana subsp. coracana]|uniref:Serpin domain-containing protein n=1 Tax=Eleusine coracana subsp. coracana TaxID=191504 RepID=A0AAV5CMM2_ELECO|nr:hypothetical protein PR202_ga16858 [Eleusine coracana subsp. coracana]
MASQTRRSASPDALTTLGLRLTKQFAEADASTGRRNVIFSPLSIYSALALVAAGARGSTLDELLALLGAGSREDLAEFLGSLDKAVDEINNWVAAVTNNLIKSVPGPSSLSPDTSVLLANAIYFKGTWDEPFRKEGTKLDKFYLLDGTTAIDSVDAQGRREPAYSRARRVQGAQSSIQSVQQMEERRPPRARVLNNMGLKLTFDSNEADHSDMTIDDGSGKPLVTSGVFHNAVIEVNEEGTEAAAVTFFSLPPGAAMWSPPRHTVDFIDDHPFAFFIIEEVTNAVVFARYLLNPLQGYSE